jgi:hypothetical protein
MGNSRRVQFSWMARHQNFRSLMGVRNHTHYTLYNHANFAYLIFADSRLSAKTTKIGPLKMFPLYGSSFFIGGEGTGRGGGMTV